MAANKPYRIEIIYVEGTPDGVVRSASGNRSENICCRFSRSWFDENRANFKDYGLLNFLQNKGIYFLVSRKVDGTIKWIYVGKADQRKDKTLGALNRINEHVTKKDDYSDWDEAVVLTLKDNSFNATQLNYLEYTFHDLLIKCNGTRAVVNSVNPPSSSPSDWDKVVLDEFVFEHSRNLVNAIGRTYLNPRERKGAVAVKASQPTSLVATRASGKSSRPFSFEMVGIEDGDTIEFIPTGVKVKVVAPNQVVHQNVQYSLSGFCKKFMPNKNKSGAYQGPKYFAYKGVELTELRNQKGV